MKITLHRDAFEFFGMHRIIPKEPAAIFSAWICLIRWLINTITLVNFFFPLSTPALGIVLQVPNLVDFFLTNFFEIIGQLEYGNVTRQLFKIEKFWPWDFWLFETTLAPMITWSTLIEIGAKSVKVKFLLSSAFYSVSGDKLTDFTVSKRWARVWSKVIANHTYTAPWRQYQMPIVKLSHVLD